MTEKIIIPSECPDCAKMDDMIGRLQERLTAAQDEIEDLRAENRSLERELRQYG